MARMIREGHLGNKGSRGGFYRYRNPVDGSSRETLDFERYEYRDFDYGKPELALRAEAAGDVSVLLAQDGKYSAYAWEILSNTLCYAAALVPDVNESLLARNPGVSLQTTMPFPIRDSQNWSAARTPHQR